MVEDTGSRGPDYGVILTVKPVLQGQQTVCHHCGISEGAEGVKRAPGGSRLTCLGNLHVSYQARDNQCLKQWEVYYRKAPRERIYMSRIHGFNNKTSIVLLRIDAAD